MKQQIQEIVAGYFLVCQLSAEGEVLALDVFDKRVSRFREHRSERTRVEHSPDLRDLIALHLIPFANECGPDGGVGHQVVQDAHIVAVSKNLLPINALNDGMQFFQGLEIWLGAMKSVKGALEQSP